MISPGDIITILIIISHGRGGDLTVSAPDSGREKSDLGLRPRQVSVLCSWVKHLTYSSTYKSRGSPGKTLSETLPSMEGQ